MKGRHIAGFALVALVWGSQWLGSQPGSPPRNLLTALQFSVAALVLSGMMAFRRVRYPSGRELWLCGVSGVMFLVVPSLGTVWAVKRMSPGLLVMLLATAPLMAALLDSAAAAKPLAALVMGVGGIALIVSSVLSFAVGQIPGVLATLGSALSSAWAVVLAKRHLRETHPLAIAAVQLVVGAVLIGLLGGMPEMQDRKEITAHSMPIVGIFAGAGNAIALTIYYWLLRKVEPHQLTTMQWVTTVVAVVEGIFLLREPPSWRMLLGTAVVLLSVVAVFGSRRGDDIPLTLQVTTPRIED